MKSLKQITVLITIFCSSFCIAQERTVNTKNSNLNWTGKAAFNAYALTGTLNLKHGKIIIEKDTITSLEITVDMKSLDHENSQLKKHLKSEDFFEVNRYNEAKFIMLQPTKIIENKATIIGEMTIKDNSRKETFTVYLNEDHSKLTFDITMDRTLYGVKFNSPSIFKKMKENAIADKFELSGKLVLD
ncbi:MAG: YceI family protein [Winogradskyella sp.]